MPVFVVGLEERTLRMYEVEAPSLEAARSAALRVSDAGLGADAPLSEFGRDALGGEVIARSGRERLGTRVVRAYEKKAA